MRSLRAAVRRLRGFLFPAAAERELAAEFESHLQLHIDDNLRAGMSPEQARRAALLTFGPVEAIKDAYRDRSSLPVLEGFRRDAAFGLRALRRQPTFALAAITTLALGIGANAAVFSVVDAVLLRPLPYPAADRIVRIEEVTAPNIPVAVSQGFIQFGPGRALSLRGPLKESLAFEAMAFAAAGAVNYGGAPAERIRGAEVAADFFDVLGVEARIGRVFSADDVQRGERLVVISDRFWRDRFDADPGVLGRELLLDGLLFTVVGVVPGGVDFPQAARVWLPAGGPTQIRGFIPGFVVMGRLRPGVTPDEAAADLRHRVGVGRTPAGLVRVIPLREALVGAVRPAAVLVWCAAGLLLLIACVNTANLLLARVASREREFAVRRALGATRGQLVRQVLAESLVLSMMAGLCALPAIVWSLDAMQALLPRTLHGVEEIRLDLRMIAATAGIAVLVALLFGLGPALSLRRGTSAELLRSQAVTPVDRFWRRFRSALLVAEVSVCLVLLVGAVALATTVARVMAIDTGVRGDRAIAIELNLPMSTHGAPERRRHLYRDLEAAVGGLPAVEASGITSALPGRPGAMLAEQVHLEGTPVPAGTDQRRAVRLSASPGYFAAAGIELIAGRPFSVADTVDSAPVMVVSEGYARALRVRPSELIGARGTLTQRRGGPRSAEIVGVVRDVRMRGPERDFYTAVYLPQDVDPGAYGPAHLIVRARGNPGALVPSIRATMAGLDPTVPLYNIETFEEIRASLIADRRFAMIMMVMFAVLGFVLSIVGLYGVISYLVQVRTREIGIRLAIGASRARIRGQILGHGLVHAALGILLGIGIVAATFRVVAARVTALGTPDPAVIAGVAALIVAVAVLASWFPAARATRIDPAVTLRAE